MSEQSPHDGGCIFCRIIAGEIPCQKIIENQNILCFLDIGPVVVGHSLVIPKRHIRNIFDMPSEVAAAVAYELPALARAICAAVEAPACHILLNSGIEAMQSVHHAHYHIIPRKSDDSFFVPWRPGKLETQEAHNLISKIQKNYENMDEGLSA